MGSPYGNFYYLCHIMSKNQMTWLNLYIANASISEISEFYYNKIYHFPFEKRDEYIIE